MNEVNTHLACELSDGEHVVLEPDYASLKYDFDRVTAERDAALGREAALREEMEASRAAFKEELEGVKYTRRRFRQERDQLQQRLTAADERADVMEGLLIRWLEEPHVIHARKVILRKDTEAALKLAEVGGNDKRKADFIRLNSAPHCPECGHPDCNGQCFGDDMMGD